jgi:hypothetical protein
MQDPDDHTYRLVKAYDTYYTQHLAHGHEKDKAMYNADSYAMFARVRYLPSTAVLRALGWQTLRPFQ